MTRLRILADDLTGALDCAAAFGAGIPVHLERPATDQPDGIDIVATATRDVPPAALADLLRPSLTWLRGADVAFKKIDSLLRGNTFDEVDWLARQSDFRGLALVPAFPPQRRITRNGQQWWQQADGSLNPVAPILEHLQARGWQVVSSSAAPTLKDEPVAWVPDVLSDDDMNAVAAHALQTPGWLWCGSAGLAHALARRLALPAHLPAHTAVNKAATEGQMLLVSASHHAVTREQWRVVRSSSLLSACLAGEDPLSLRIHGAGYPSLMDLSSAMPLSPSQAATLLQEQTAAIARHVARPRVLVVVGGDTLLAMCRALGAHGLTSETALDRPGWGCARMVGGQWDGLLCHTRSGAFGGPDDLLEVISLV